MTQTELIEAYVRGKVIHVPVVRIKKPRVVKPVEAPNAS